LVLTQHRGLGAIARHIVGTGG